MNYQKVYDQIIDRARERKLGGYKEKHHVIPKCMGGSNKKENLVELTAREHFVCHWLLSYMYPQEKKLAYAFWGMCNQTSSENNNRSYKVTSRAYQVGRELFIEAITGRECTWGDKISQAKKGVSQGKRSEDSIAKQKQTVTDNPYIHSEKSKQIISEKLSKHKKTKEHRKAISETNKRLGIKPPTQAKPVEVYGKSYASIKEACEDLGQPRHVVNKIIKRVGN